MTRLLALASILLSSSVSAGPCAIPSIAPGVVSLQNGSIAEGGGVIVALQDAGFGPTKLTDTIEQKAWRFRDVNQLVVPAIRTIAPGLAVYALPPAGGPKLVLEDDEHKPLVTIRRALDKQPAPTALKVAKVIHQTHTGGAGPRSYTTNEITVKLSGKLPPTAMAFVIYRVAKPEPLALSWTLAFDHDATTVLVFRSPGRCETRVPGLVEPVKGDRVVVAWLDTSGRLSPMSNEIVVTAG